MLSYKTWSEHTSNVFGYKHQALSIIFCVSVKYMFVIYIIMYDFFPLQYTGIYLVYPRGPHKYSPPYSFGQEAFRRAETEMDASLGRTEMARKR